MRFKILAMVIILCLVMLGCVKENKTFTVNQTSPIATPTETKEFKEKWVTPAITQTTVTPKPITTGEKAKRQKTSASSQAINITEILNKLKKMAYDLAILIADPDVRQLLHSQIIKSDYAENKVDIKEFFTALELSLSSLNWIPI